MRVQQHDAELSSLTPVDVSFENPLPGRTSPGGPIIARTEHSGVYHNRGAERLYDRAGIGFITSGLIDYKAETGMATAVPGTVLFGNVGEYFRVLRLDDSEINRLVVWYDGAFLQEIAQAYGLQNAKFPVVALPPGKRAASFYARMQALARGLADSLDVASALAVDGLCLKDGHSREVPISTRDRQRVLSAVGYVQQSFSEPCAIETLAAVSGLSRFHFMRLFKAVTGLSPNQYVINLRLREAAVRISETRMPISEIALNCGFNDISHFNTSFRAMFACTPRQMRCHQGRARCA